MLDAFSEQHMAVVENWLSRLEHAIPAGGDAELRSLFRADSYWRDMLALTWNLQTCCGGEAIAERLAPALREAGASGFRVELSSIPPRCVARVETETIEAFFTFETGTGRGRGIVRLCANAEDESRFRAWTFLTALEELKGFEERVGRNRPTGQSHSRDFRGPNWLDQRREAAAYKDWDPAVLVVGGGQAGLAIAARLTQLGVDTLIVDRHARIGDNWRHRYHALTLHNQVQVNHLPYMPFPPNWPTYIPKDKLANWFEAYADAMELNFWTGAELVGGAYDEREGRWAATLHCADGSERVLRPRHVVMATGVSGIPNWPEIPGLDAFSGRVVHSSEYRDGEDWTGKRAIVIGTGNSGHDIAQDLHSSGAEVTLVQRSPTLVVNIEPSAQLPYALYSEGPSLEDCDLIATSMPMPLMKKAHVRFTEKSRELDKPLLDRLEWVGFRLDFGEDGTGWQFKYLTRGGGYYFNVGCSDLIAEGRIRLIQYNQLGGFTERGARLKDGETIGADLVVLATGYKGQEHLVAKLFGNEMAGRVGPIWGFGDGLELRNMYCRTGQPGLWFIAGSLAQCRINSKYLGLQIKAVEEGLVSTDAA
jgi:putative flavoprotein involved in K+ transport